jgi:GTPase SAR1 family protein
MSVEPGKIRNVAVVGHRSTGKTSLVEAMLYQSGAINRLGTIEAGNTTGDWDDDEHARQMSLAASLCHVEWQGRKINLIDTPGDPGFQGDMIAALRVVEGALVVGSAPRSTTSPASWSSTCSTVSAPTSSGRSMRFAISSHHAVWRSTYRSAQSTSSPASSTSST